MLLFVEPVDPHGIALKCHTEFRDMDLFDPSFSRGLRSMLAVPEIEDLCLDFSEFGTCCLGLSESLLSSVVCVCVCVSVYFISSDAEKALQVVNTIKTPF